MNVTMSIIGIIVFLIGYLWIDYTLGRKKQVAKMKKRILPYRQSDLEILTHGPDLFKSIFDDIEHATKHIHILFYIVKNDDLSKGFLNLLKNKAKEGVEVRLLLDWVGSFTVSKKEVKDLKEAGVKFSFCHVPSLPFFFYSSQVRNHRKITVIDGKIGYMGGYNIGKEYVDMDPKLSPWRDYHLRMTGEGVQDLQLEFLHDWAECTKTNLVNNTIYFPNLHQGKMLHQISPTEGVHLEEMFSDLIRKSRTSIFIGTPYFIPSKKIFNDLIQALERGIQLTVLVPKTSDHALVKEASFIYLRQLIKKGAKVFQFVNGFYHAKVVVIDEEICDIGTANFDKRSLFLNHELNCFIYDRPFIQKVMKVIETDIEDSKELTLKELNRPDLIRSFKEVMARPISHFL